MNDVIADLLLHSRSKGSNFHASGHPKMSSEDKYYAFTLVSVINASEFHTLLLDDIL